MSEYQYYEFAAIDEPLSDKQMGELRALSTRAEISRTSFVNEYQWGSFKGDPRKLMVEYFDAFLYYANWGTLWCMFRLPKDGVDLAALKRFDTPEAIDIMVKGKAVVVEVCIHDDSGNYEVPYDLSLAAITPARDSLLDGDLGPLYVAWLAAVQRGLVEEETPEPCDVSQLPPLSTGTRAIASFLQVHEDLLKTAYKPAQKKLRVDGAEQLAKWAKSLPADEKDEYLARFIAEPATAVRSKLLKQYRAILPKNSARSKGASPRKAGELLAVLDGE